LVDAEVAEHAASCRPFPLAGLDECFELIDHAVGSRAVVGVDLAETDDRRVPGVLDGSRVLEQLVNQRVGLDGEVLDEREHGLDVSRRRLRGRRGGRLAGLLVVSGGRRGVVVTTASAEDSDEDQGRDERDPGWACGQVLGHEAWRPGWGRRRR
jgi:hypothetical protein